MYAASSKYDTSFLRVRIDFSKSGRRGFRRVNSGLGKAFIPADRLMRDLAEYIERRIDGGDPMIAEFDVCYEGGIFLTVFLTGGAYFITEVTNIGTVIAAQAVLVWTRVKRGCDYLLRQVLVGWRCLTDRTEPAGYCL